MINSMPNWQASMKTTAFRNEYVNKKNHYKEIDDEALFNKIGESPVCKRWWKYMTEVLVCESDDSPKAIEDMLTEVFHLD